MASKLQAVFRSTADEAGPLIEDASKQVASVAEDGAGRIEANAAEQVGVDAEHAANIQATGDLAKTQDQAAAEIGGGATAAGGAGGGGRSRISEILGGNEEPRLPSASIDNPEGVPGAGLNPESYNAQRLGTLNESAVTRDENGLIDSVDGKPVNDYLNDLSKERSDIYRQGKEDGTIPRRAQGNSIATGLDRRTGTVYEGVNGRDHDIIPPGELHPTLKDNYDAIQRNGPYAWTEGGPLEHEVPFKDDPLGHGEVKATNMALHDREAQNLPTDASALSELTMAPIFPFIDRNAPFCANCTPMLGDVESTTGKLTSQWDRLT